jgi:hypothetical protein
VRGLKELGKSPKFDEKSDGMRVCPVDHFAQGLLGALHTLEEQLVSNPQRRPSLVATADSVPLLYRDLTKAIYDGDLVNNVISFDAWLNLLSKSERNALFPLLPIIRSRRYWELDEDENVHDEWHTTTRLPNHCPAFNFAAIQRFVKDTLSK